MVGTTAGRSGWSPFSVKDDTTHVAIICGRFDGENLLFASIVLVAPSLTVDSASLSSFSTL